MNIHPHSDTYKTLHTKVLDALGWTLPEKPLIVAGRTEGITNLFDEYVGILFPDGSLKLWAATTEPGLAPYMNQGTGGLATHPAGVARVKTGFHEDIYGFGYHKVSTHGYKQPCMKQREPIVFERWDGLMWVLYIADYRGLNIHRSRWDGTATNVGHFSHGCLVFANRIDHWNFLLALGYPEHGRNDPTWEAALSLRFSLLVIQLDKTP